MDLTELKKIWKEHGFRPNKRLGQNFLIDNNIRDKILSFLPIGKDDTVVEIGPGFGAMSLALADLCGRLIAVEKDTKMCGILDPLLKKRGNIELCNGDILETDFRRIAFGKEKIFIFGNIPYYISTPLMEKVINDREKVRGLYIVIQEEVADRIVAPPGSKTYGSLSCYVQYFAAVKKLFRIKKQAFCPSPKVESALLGMDMLASPSVQVRDEALMLEIIRKAFSQRRKKAVNPLVSADVAGMGKAEWEHIFMECGISAAARAETISLADYARIADAVSAQR
ncbi:MAG: 16S rRNA (adenine(1518)-N(6)/adenine(1519)-N(6))-dimethyltransferase RsmA [Candidatus Omnitrophota bacterium]|nr:ribosomal RNA small subunit methyltransferase A [Candidatus Omnitrophota bacterium]